MGKVTRRAVAEIWSGRIRGGDVSLEDVQSAIVGGWLQSLLTAQTDTRAAHPAGDDNFITLDFVGRRGLVVTARMGAGLISTHLLLEAGRGRARDGARAPLYQFFDTLNGGRQGPHLAKVPRAPLYSIPQHDRQFLVPFPHVQDPLLFARILHLFLADASADGRSVTPTSPPPTRSPASSAAARSRVAPLRILVVAVAAAAAVAICIVGGRRRRRRARRG